MLSFPTHERFAADSRDAVGAAFSRGSDAMTVHSIIATLGPRLAGVAVGRLPA